MKRARPIGGRDAYARALGLLARREHSARELGAKLGARGFGVAEVERTLAQLAAEGALSNRRYAESLARERLAQGYGPRRIEAELVARGVVDEDIRAALGALAADWEAVATAALARRCGAALTEPAGRAKRAAFLLRRGFDPATVRALTRATIGAER